MLNSVILFTLAEGGMGKSTAMKHLAISWADGTTDELNKFDFVFHISLKHVRTNKSLARIIIAQHNGLEANKVTPAEIECILEDKKIKTLLLIDGHDEYKCGINTDIDKAIERKSFWNCSLIVTSRDTTQIQRLKKCMDAEVEIQGFDVGNIERCAEKLLGSKEKAKTFLGQAITRNIYPYNPLQPSLQLFLQPPTTEKCLLSIPILLHMLCTLFHYNKSLPETTTGIMQEIVNRCINRESIRAKGEKALQNATSTLIKLGKLAWQGLITQGKKLIFDKVLKLTAMIRFKSSNSS